MGNSPSSHTLNSERIITNAIAKPSKITAKHFDFTIVGHHGIPSNTKTMTYCSAQGLLALGTASGTIKLYGKNGLEMLLDPSMPLKMNSSIISSVKLMIFTGLQNLIVIYTDSSIRIYNFQEKNQGKVIEIDASWTTNTIIQIESLKYSSLPYVYLGLDDGTVRVLQEITGEISSYQLSPEDLGIKSSGTSEREDLEVDNSNLCTQITAMATNPEDANQLLIAYNCSDIVYLVDLNKRKVYREFSITTRTSKKESPLELGHATSLSWHNSGKYFAVSYSNGGFGTFKYDKTQGLYHVLPEMEILELKWLTAPPTSVHVSLPGALVVRCKSTDTDTNIKLSVIYPPNRLASDDAFHLLMKESTKLLWNVSPLRPPSRNANILAFALSSDHLDICLESAPFSIIYLSGNPLDGHLPAISIQQLPCFIRLKENDKEEWEWRFPDSLPLEKTLERSRDELTASCIVTIEQCDRNLQEDLECMWSSNSDNVDINNNEDFHWPIHGGSVSQPLEHTFHTLGNSSVLLLTGYNDGKIDFHEIVSPSNCSSQGLLRFLMTLKLSNMLKNEQKDDTEQTDLVISCLEFCINSRLLVVGLRNGRILVLKMAESNTENGFQLYLNQHIHTSGIKMIALSSKYGFIASADESGVVSLTNLETQACELLIVELASTEDISVDSLLLSEFIQVTDLPMSPLKVPPNSNIVVETRQPLQIREPVCILSVGRGNSCLEMFYAASGKKITKSMFGNDVDKSVTSLLMVNEDGKKLDIPGKPRKLDCCEKNPIIVEDKNIKVEVQETNEESADGETSAFPKEIEEIEDSLVKLTSDRRPQFLVCACGRDIHIVLATLPSAAELASSQKEVKPVISLATAAVKSIVVSMHVVEIPVDGTISTALVVIDQSHTLYIYALLSLQLICSCFLPMSIDQKLIVSTNGELLSISRYGEITRYCLFSETVASEVAALQRECVKSQLLLPERKNLCIMPMNKRKTSNGIAGAGKMLKHLVMKPKQVDLNKVFDFNAMEREELLGEAETRAQTSGKNDDEDKLANPKSSKRDKVKKHLGRTQDVLHEAAQHLHERGEKLNDLAEKSEQMKSTSEDFYKTMRAFNEKNASKKWYQI